TRDAASAVQILHEIEAQSGLAATGLVNNSHLQGETSLAAIEASFPFAEEAARLLRLPLVCTTFPAGLFETEAREGHHEGGGTPGREGHHEGEGFPDKKGFLKREGFPADGCNPRTRGAYGGSVPEKTVRLSKYAAQKPYLVRIYVRTPWE
ncbi:MAG: hypothetical protein LBG81_01180, partial [Coriobacteriaceae bacterium]|nr:hypothetical protein [Coriobacteriaceae bacterium]